MMNDMKSCRCLSLCPVSLGIAIGLTCGLFMIAYAWIAWIWGFGLVIIEQYAAFYVGYGASLWGGLIGGLWGFFIGFIFGALIALFYDLVACCMKKCSNDSSRCRCCS